MLNCRMGEKCPAYLDAEQPCWENRDSACHRQFRHCENCRVFIRYGKSRIQARDNLPRRLIRSRAFWTSLVLLAVILLFTYFSFARLSNYGGRLTGNFRNRQLESARTATRSLSDFYKRLRHYSEALGAAAGPEQAAKVIREQIPAADSACILFVAHCGADSIRPLAGDYSGADSLIASILRSKTVADTLLCISQTADSLDQLLVAGLYAAGEDRLLIVSDANRVLEQYFREAAVDAPLLYWLLDADGRVLRFPIRYNATPFYSISRKNFSRCSGCHVSDYDEELSTQFGTHIIPYPEGKRSLIAWSTAGFLDRPWTLVLTQPHSDLNVLLNENIFSIRMYLFFVLGMVFLFLVFNFVNLHWQVLLEAEKKVLEGNLSATEKIRNLEGALEKVQRMEGLSVLAGGLAHEINNPITNIVLYTRLLRPRMQDSDQLSDLDIIERESNKVKNIIIDMLSYIRRSYAGGPPRSLSLNELLYELVDINTARLKKSEVTVRYEFQHDLPELKADANKIMQVMANLFNNAVDAMKSGGTLLLRTGSGTESPEGTHVFFVVSDTGPGIPPELLDKVFEAFYTTKPVGVGTGLGLPVSKAIVEKMGGRIQLHSAAGQGTTVKVIFPLT